MSPLRLLMIVSLPLTLAAVMNRECRSADPMQRAQCERDIISELKRVIPEILKFERQWRHKLLEDEPRRGRGKGPGVPGGHQQAGAVAVRKHSEGDQGARPLADFIAALVPEMAGPGGGADSA